MQIMEPDQWREWREWYLSQIRDEEMREGIPLEPSECPSLEEYAHGLLLETGGL